VNELHWRQAGVYRDKHGAGPGNTEIKFVVTVAVQREYGNPVTFFHAQAVKAGSQSGDPILKLPPVLAAATETGGNIVTMKLDGVADGLRE
jgi:hypothetical protein